MWPYIGKPVVMVLLLISSFANYAMYHYGIYIDSDMIRNVMETHPGEALDLFTFSAFLWVLVLGILPSVVLARIQIVYHASLKEVFRRIALIFACGIVISAIAAVSYKEYAAFGRNNRNVTRLINPSNYLYSTFRYFQKQALQNQSFITLDPYAKHVPYKKKHVSVFVIVVGETARSMNFSINGYPRNTNPNLSKQDIISFKDVASAGTSTAYSLPAMFSSLPNKSFNVENARYRENLLDVLQQTGYDILWRENDNGCKGVCERVTTQNMIDIKEFDFAKYCDSTYCYDEVLLQGLEDYIKSIKKDTVIVLHMIGSHGPTYYRRYPDEFKKYQPACDTAEIQKCSKEAIVNTYDNTILYTDYVLSGLINILKKFEAFETGMLYVSDHGESLGENNIYLHGLPYMIAPEEQTKVPMLLWLSDKMKRENYINSECLASYARNTSISHDFVFSSVLSLMNVNTKDYNPKFDFLRSCRRTP
jgi:lipid A ethanolaminephosphotransferase